MDIYIYIYMYIYIYINIHIRQKCVTLYKRFLIFNNQVQKLHFLPKNNFNEKWRNRYICPKSVPGF